MVPQPLFMGSRPFNRYLVFTKISWLKTLEQIPKGCRIFHSCFTLAKNVKDIFLVNTSWYYSNISKMFGICLFYNMSIFFSIADANSFLYKKVCFFPSRFLTYQTGIIVIFTLYTNSELSLHIFDGLLQRIPVVAS